MRRNVRSRRGHFLAESQYYFVLHDILPKEHFAELQKLAIESKSLFLRKNSFARQGAPLIA